MARRLWLSAGVAALCAATVSACVENPVGSAREGGIYAAKATRSAESALSAVQTVRLVAEAASDGKVFGPYASIAVSQQEDALTEIGKLFRSIQPPDAESRQLRAELSDLLDSARDGVAAVRIEVRSGHLDTAGEVAAPLADDAEQLKSFAEAHK